MSIPKILLIEDQRMIAEGIAHLLHQHYQVEFAHNMQEMQDKISFEKFDLLLLDMKMNDGNTGVQYMQYLHSRNLPVLIVANAITEVELFLSNQLRARGALTKSLSADELLAAIQVILDGGRAYPNATLRRMDIFQKKLPKLTPRYLSILSYVLADEYKTDPQIAALENLGLGTVKNYISYIVKTFSANTRRELTDMLREMGFTPDLLTLVYSYLSEE